MARDDSAVQSERAARIDACLAAGAPAHLMGVGGVGMAGLARLLLDRGVSVSGCDASSGRLTEWLAVCGVSVAQGHDPAHVTQDTGWLIRSAAVPVRHPEALRAAELGLPVFARGEVLPRIVRDRFAVAVAGTHGKTTTSGFIAQILKACGRDPSWCIGGELDVLGGVAGTGGGPHIVVEADESDGTLALYEPDVAVVTNVEFDHMENFANVEAFRDVFRAFARRARCLVLAGADDPGALETLAGCPRLTTFGFARGADWRARLREEGPEGSVFDVLHGGRAWRGAHLPLPGRHNVLNTLAAVAAAAACGVSPEESLGALAGLRAARRRFETVAQRGSIRVVSDYAHHPTEIRALVRTALRQPAARRRAVFQAHRHTRTRALGAEFPAAFAGLDEVILLPVYAASEPPMEGGMLADLYAAFRAVAVGRRRMPRVFYAASQAEAAAYLSETLVEGDLLLVVGAGDIEQLAARARDWPALSADGPRGGYAAMAADLAGALRDSEARAREPLAQRTGLRVGGAADLWVAARSERDLRAALAWAHGRGVPVHVLGGGFNVLPGDLGVRGLVVRPAGPEMRRIRQEGDVVCAGAGVPLGRLLDWSERRARAGLEFLHGVPGTVGGAVAMNAGAWGGEIGEHVLWIRALKRDGNEIKVLHDEMGFSYRGCAALKEAVLLEAAFRLDAGDGEAIRARRRELGERRAWMEGFHTAGSMFRNPPGDYAGRLLDEAGFKGARLGGAEATATHPNVICTEKTATASDVRALMERMATTVARRAGVRLEPEVKVWT